MYIVYHSHADVTQTTNPVANRTPCFDRLVIRPDGSLAVSGPSIYMQPIPSGANGLYKKQSGVTVTSDYPTLNGSPENLLDGIVTGRLGDTDLYRFEVTADGWNLTKPSNCRRCGYGARSMRPSRRRASRRCWMTPITCAPRIFPPSRGSRPWC